jgi:hypothetical protein
MIRFHIDYITYYIEYASDTPAAAISQITHSPLADTPAVSRRHYLRRRHYAD